MRYRHNNASTNTSVFDNLGNLFHLAPSTTSSPATSGLTIGNGGSLDLNGVSQAVASLSDYTPGSGGNIFNSATATPTVLTLQPASGTSVFSGSIQGGGSLGAISLAVNGNGVQVLTGANTYTGSTTVNGGTLQIGNGGTTGSINATSGVVTNAILAFNRSDNISFAPAISGSGGVTQMGPGAVALTGSLSYTGQTTLVNAALTVGNAQNMTLAGAIVGSGTFSKAGAGTLTLGGYSTYSGPTVIVAGTVTVPQALQFQTAVLSVGGTTTPGSITAALGPANQGTMNIVGHGNDFWGGTEQGEYAYVTVPNQAFDVAVHLASLNTNNTDGWSKSGIMARIDASNNNVDTVIAAQTSGNQVSFQWTNNGQNTSNQGTAAPNWLRLTYDGNGNFEQFYDNSSSSTAPPANDPGWLPLLSGGTGAAIVYNVPSFASAKSFELGIADSAPTTTVQRTPRSSTASARYYRWSLIRGTRMHCRRRRP